MGKHKRRAQAPTLHDIWGVMDASDTVYAGFWRHERTAEYMCVIVAPQFGVAGVACRHSAETGKVTYLYLLDNNTARSESGSPELKLIATYAPGGLVTWE